MNLLVLSNNLKRASFRQRIGVYLDTLRANGIDCEVAQFHPRSLNRWKMLKRCADFDGVFLHKKILNFLDAVWLRRYAKSVIYDFDDAIMYYDERPQRKPSRHKHTNPFKRTTKLANVVIAGNSYLAEHARKFNPGVEVLPTGLDTDAYKLQVPPKKDDKIRLVWIGSKTTLRYLVEIKPALEEIGSRFDNVILRIICDDFFDLQKMQVEKHLWSLETQAFDLAASDIGLAPLPDNRFARGKCGFKILQYAVAGLPVIASPIGINADYVRDGTTGFLATNTRQWVNKITQLIENPQLRRKMGGKGLAQAKNFDVSVIGKQLVELITKCLQDARP